MSKAAKYNTEQNSAAVGFHIQKTAAFLKFAAINLLKELNLGELTLEQYEVLFVLIKNDGLYQRQLGKILIKDRPNITRLVNILEEKGLIVRKNDADNKRLWRIFITEQGHKKVDALAPLKEKMIEKVKGALSDEEIETLIKTLIKLQDYLSPDFTMQT